LEKNTLELEVEACCKRFHQPLSVDCALDIDLIFKVVNDELPRQWRYGFGPDGPVVGKRIIP